MAERVDRSELRALIREALKEALGDDPSRKEPSRNPSPTPPREGEGRAAHFESGVLNESKVAELGRTHSKIVIGTDVAVTPLARDRAREIRVEIVRQKP
jgi:hypothetical protein